jgi:hypothetical protein
MGFILFWPLWHSFGAITETRRRDFILWTLRKERINIEAQQENNDSVQIKSQKWEIAEVSSNVYTE